jgi:chromosome segregation ATPase
MKEVDQLIEGIGSKINTLIITLEQLRRENERLRISEQDLASIIQQQKETMERLQNKINPIIQSNKSEETDITEIRKRISGLVRDIDKCISLLNK